MLLSNSIPAPSVRWEICVSDKVIRNRRKNSKPRKFRIIGCMFILFNMPSKFIEILDPSDNLRFSDSDVRLEDVLADHEAIVTRPRSATKTSDRSDRDNSSSPAQRWKRLSTILIMPRRPSTS
ncbi:uncharacterized protein NFIA_072810 [Aspergillus fischeri NRRL 181]|uniref:Uncharacterized protein n=1 Tax=Neosartorya fischeri (strain ATCC 1020 / DSM 3700 / CBS 544.65 / FGSC A1164 / JCM 1740 / NRRL 181 / WB 181) TaxID=331117 RepID=A1DDA9_NEOFI|nr:conserved hypothetical protein [Aspergillus fischeri NRRL 181]EAW17366.1 conserved hypothetical protein [Aspergillus fischeri NRRL 181]